jgi:hypothetical protein
MSNVPGTILGVSRLCVGALSLAVPGTSARVFGIEANRTNSWVTRLFGSRELILAGALLAAKEPDVRTIALVGAAVDGLDVLSSAVELGRGRLSTWSSIIGGGGAVLFVALGLLAARAQSETVPT